MLGLRNRFCLLRIIDKTLLQRVRNNSSCLNKQENVLVHKIENPVAGVKLAGLSSEAQCFFSSYLWEDFICRMDGLSLPLACHMALLELVARQEQTYFDWPRLGHLHNCVGGIGLACSNHMEYVSKSVPFS